MGCSGYPAAASGVTDFAGQCLEWVSTLIPHHTVQFQLTKGASWPQKDPASYRTAAGAFTPESFTSTLIERLREGIVAFEKVRILRGLLDRKDIGEAREQLRQTLSRFDYQRAQAEPAAEAVNSGNEFLNSFTDRLLRK